MTTQTHLHFRGISKSFGSTTALKAFELEVHAGELLTLLGPSGCGKSTALRIAAGFERPNCGEVILGGQDVTMKPAHERNIGMVFQSYSLFPHLTVIENVTFGLKMRRISSKKAQTKGLEMLELVRLDGLAARYPHQLSGGQQQRVALARALAIQPDLLLLDEPLSALDAKVRAEVRDEIRQLSTTLGTTTIFVTHDQEEALGISDRICVMNLGSVEQLGTPAEIYDSPRTSFVASFVGELNEICVNDEQRLVRPEQIVFVAADTSTLSGSVEWSSFHGAFLRYRVRLDDGQVLTALTPHTPGNAFQIGSRVGIVIQEVRPT